MAGCLLRCHQVSESFIGGGGAAVGACSVPSSPRFFVASFAFCARVRGRVSRYVRAMVSASSSLTGAARHAAPLWLLRPMAGTHLRLPRGALPRRVDAVRIERLSLYLAAVGERRRRAREGRAQGPDARPARVARCAGRARAAAAAGVAIASGVGCAGEVEGGGAGGRCGAARPRHAPRALRPGAQSSMMFSQAPPRARPRTLVWGHIGFQPQTQVPILVACLGFDAVTSDGDD